MKQYEQIFSKIYGEIRVLKKPLIIGISGAYTSGKTTFTKGMSEYFNTQGVKTQILHYDDFHYPLSSITWEPGNLASEVEAFYNRAFNSKKLISEVLEPLREKNSLLTVIKGLNWGTELYENDVSINIDESTIVILEGVLLFRTCLIPYFEYKIFIEINETEILKRGESRDVPQMGEWILDKYKTRYIPVHKRYVSEDKPQNMADIVIDNNDYQNPKIM